MNEPAAFVNNAVNKPTSNVLFWAVTVVDAPRDMPNVRLAIGSNAASIWWLNGQEVVGIYNDPQPVTANDYGIFAEVGDAGTCSGTLAQDGGKLARGWRTPPGASRAVRTRDLDVRMDKDGAR